MLSALGQSLGENVQYDIFRHVLRDEGFADAFGHDEGELAVLNLLVLPHQIEERFGRGQIALDIGKAALHAHIGEVGIDLYWDESRREEQVAILQRQAEWAARFHLPLVIHSRSAHRLLVDTLLPFADRVPGGVFHCFGGTTEEAQELFHDAGMYDKERLLKFRSSSNINIYDLDGETAGKLFALATCIARAMKDALKCDGLNLVQNNGEVAGQTVNHFHLHLIPRYEGDGLNLNWPQQEISGEQLEEIRQSIKKSI